MKKKFFKNNMEMALSILIFGLLLWGFIYFGSIDYTQEIINETEYETLTFKADNIYEYINASDALNYVKGKNIILLFGVNNDITKEYGNLLNDIAIASDVDKIYFYDISLDREEDNASYRSLVEYLGNYATYLEGEKADIYGPTLLIKSEGNIIYFDNEAAVTTGKYDVDEYFNNYTKNSMSNLLPVVFEDYLEANNGKK